MAIEVEIRGMTCDSCASHVERALARAGAKRADVDWRTGRARVEAATLDENELERALADTRYRVERITRLRPPESNGGAASYDYDLVVIGSGGGAFAGAIRARDLGRSVLMVERGTIGGTCVNVGCVPSKRLLVSSASARVTGTPALAEAVRTKAALVDELRQKKYVDLLDGYGIEFRAGDALLAEPHVVIVDGEEVTGEAILVATGARPAVPDVAGLDAARFLTSTTALDLEAAPERLAVLGAGPVGLELGQMLGNFGSEVTFLGRRDVVPAAEPEIREALREALEADGHRVIAPAVVDEIALESSGKVIRGSAAGQRFELQVDEILVATGRVPNTESLGLEDIGVGRDSSGAITVDAEQRTSVPSVYAAGDVTTQPRFVYVAAAAGAAAAENAFGDGEARLDFAALPQIVFTEPALAQAGSTEADARAAGFEIETAILPLTAVPRALVNGDTRGLFKLVAEAGSGRLLGASILAEGAPDAIQAAVIAIDRGMTVRELASGWAPYLAMAEGLKLAAQTFDRDVARLSCCAA